MADQLLFEQSQEPQGMSEPFISRQVVYCIDQNNGNYAGQIQLDTSSLSNSGKYASYSEAYLEVPLVLTMVGADAAFNVEAPFAVGLKNGFHHLIHSMSVEYNNTNVIQLTPYSDFDVSYRLMTSLSEEDVKKFGQSIGFIPDSVDSFAYTQANWTNTNNRQGQGISNNRNFPTTAANLARWASYANTTNNAGFFERQKNTAFEFQTPSSSFLSEANGKVVGKNYYTKVSAGGNTTHTWYIMARIRLKDTHDFFDKMPLVKGAYLRFIINVNTCSHTLTFTKSGGVGTDVALSQESATITQGGISPVLVASGENTQGLAPIATRIQALADGAYTCTVALNIGKSAAGDPHPTWGPQTRLYVPLYQMNPVQEEQYLSLNRTKKIVYNDIYQYQTNVDATSTFNALLTNGIPNPKTIVIMPFLQSSANRLNLTATGVATPPYLSPFASEPATTSPLIALKNFNIQLAGVNMFIQNEDYDFEQFQNELSRQNAINGGLVDGLTSGLISEKDFQTMYRYYVCDVSRRLPAEDAVPKSVQILGQNQASVPITLFTFIQFQRSIEIDLATGQKLG